MDDIFAAIRREPKAGDFDAAFGMLVCVSLLAGPITWWHYLTVAAIPLVLIVTRLRARRFPLWPSVWFAAAAGLFAGPNYAVLSVAAQFGSQSGRMVVVSPYLALVATALSELAVPPSCQFTDGISSL